MEKAQVHHSTESDVIAVTDKNNVEGQIEDLHKEIPDPDAGLSDEERAHIVGFLRIPVSPNSKKANIDAIGSQTSLEARLEAHAMALFALSDLFP